MTRMAQEFAERLMKAKEDLDRSRGESVNGDGEPSMEGRNEENGSDMIDGVDLNASTEVVPATEQFVSKMN